jgi:hypothetical protein
MKLPVASLKEIIKKDKTVIRQQGKTIRCLEAALAAKTKVIQKHFGKSR